MLIGFLFLAFGALDLEGRSYVPSFDEIATCSQQDAMAGLCDGNNDDGLDLEDFRPGDPAPPPEHPAPQPGGPGPNHPVPPQSPGNPQSPAQPSAPGGGGWQCVDPDGLQIGGECGTEFEDPTDPEAPAPQRPPIPPELDQYDVARFMPQPTVPTIEPFGVAIMNAPMNVAYEVSSHIVGGNLFNAPVNVTFTPDIITIDYGDGTQATASGSAATWAGLGQQQLTPTATSHTYRERGTATVTIEVAYVATADFGRWGVYPVRGHIVSRSAGAAVQIYEKQSYLVERTCQEDPQGPGC